MGLFLMAPLFWRCSKETTRKTTIHNYIHVFRGYPKNTFFCFLYIFLGGWGGRCPQTKQDEPPIHSPGLELRLQSVQVMVCCGKGHPLLPRLEAS